MASTKRKQQEQLPGWVWMLFGLTIGLGVALVVYIDSNEVRVSDTLRELATEIRPAVRERPADTAADGARDESPAGDTGDAAASDSGEPALSFYTRLRNSEVVVTGGGLTDAVETPAPQIVELQAGSFPTIQGADTRQATLALLGIASRIDPAVVDDTLRYRVIIGPLNGRDEIARVTRHLDEKDIEFIRRQPQVPD